ncbi:sensor histidine kinase [Paraclostridium sordellii]|uniref:histidine kinase n=1 Tax=Paraclostridium sordellii TaxID=1505 RepID=A0A9P1L4K8_PARSO|nr:HAMP domain-containing sensor histidine kinase [Paeniclostridium sordellii]CEK33816.1 sensor signal transduction histidine kinase,Sensor histidine kinase YycG,two-component sensor protein,Predicted periplasmic ligand-binding sensor domain,phosphate regulon sensor kinase PhoR,Histidine kinase-, DNA gyrase B-, and HSP90-like ATPase [[Clostridium] sordellii] [Paeniclostridium sordellii]CEO33312.1 sensor signal transduction histidine kinase [[Clostridium] sordellii] [Paeniclostridium sordellii]CE
MIGSILLNIFLIIVVIILFLDNMSIKKQVKNIIYFLDNIENDKTRVKLQVNLKYKYIEELSQKINYLIKSQSIIIANTKEQENKLKAFIVSISHDLRTPLTSIKGYIQLLEKEISETKKRNYISIVKKKIQILNDLINDFFTMSLYDSNEYKLNLEKINITKLLTEVLMDNYNNFKRKSINPLIQMKEEDIYIIGDKIACERIINNLISNAIKYTTNSIIVELTRNDNYCFINISNECSGISDKDLEKMSDRFFRVDKSRSSEGSGIGLYIVKVLIERLGWEFLIEKNDDILTVKMIIPTQKF